MTTAASEHRICTNKLLMDIIEFDKALFDTSNLSVDEIKYFNSIIDGFNNQTQFYIDWLDSDEARRIFYENEQYNDHTFAKIDEQIKKIVHNTSLKADEIISRIYDSGLQAGADEIKRTRYYNDATKYGLHFLQSYNFELISNVNDDLKNHIQEEIFAGIAAGEGMPEVAKRILDATNHSLTGKTLSARQRAMMIARTESARAMTQGRLQSYANYGVHEVKILTAGDDNVCAICREAETKIYLIEDAGDLVPFHPLCRCSVMAYIRHGILPGYPDSDADPILCLNNATQNNVKFNSTKVSSSDSGNVIDAGAEFKIISEKSHILIGKKGSERTYYVECTENSNIDFPTETYLKDELCYEYKIFADENKKKLLVTFYRSRTGTNVSFIRTLEVYERLPKKLKVNCEKIVLSNQSSRNSMGYVHPDKPKIINILKPNDENTIWGTLTHEMAHCFDFTNKYVSNSDLYVRNLNEDLRKKLPNGDFSKLTADYFITEPAFDDYIGQGEHENAPYAEDFADSVEMFLINHSVFKKRYPNKANYLNKLLS